MYQAMDFSGKEVKLSEMTSIALAHAGSRSLLINLFKLLFYEINNQMESALPDFEDGEGGTAILLAH